MTVAGGNLGEVTLAKADGERVEGSTSGSTWTADEALAPSARYTLVASASNAAGDDVTRRWSFTTTSDVATDLPAVTPLADATVGVGHPVIVYFDEDVTDRATVRAI